MHRTITTLSLDMPEVQSLRLRFHDWQVVDWHDRTGTPSAESGNAPRNAPRSPVQALVGQPQVKKSLENLRHEMKSQADQGRLSIPQGSREPVCPKMGGVVLGFSPGDLE
jgi:hypothetical protein